MKWNQMLNKFKGDLNLKFLREGTKSIISANEYGSLWENNENDEDNKSVFCMDLQARQDNYVIL